MMLMPPLFRHATHTLIDFLRCFVFASWRRCRFHFAAAITPTTLLFALRRYDAFDTPLPLPPLDDASI